MTSAKMVCAPPMFATNTSAIVSGAGGVRSEEVDIRHRDGRRRHVRYLRRGVAEDFRAFWQVLEVDIDEISGHEAVQRAIRRQPVELEALHQSRAVQVVEELLDAEHPRVADILQPRLDLRL